MIQQIFSAEESVMDRLASQGREIFGLVWENTEGPNPVQVWRKKDRFEMRFGNRVVQSSCLREDPDQLVLSYTPSYDTMPPARSRTAKGASYRTRRGDHLKFSPPSLS